MRGEQGGLESCLQDEIEARWMVSLTNSLKDDKVE